MLWCVGWCGVLGGVVCGVLWCVGWCSVGGGLLWVGVLEVVWFVGWCGVWCGVGGGVVCWVGGGVVYFFPRNIFEIKEGFSINIYMSFS